MKPMESKVKPAEKATPVEEVKEKQADEVKAVEEVKEKPVEEVKPAEEARVNGVVEKAAERLTIEIPNGEGMLFLFLKWELGTLLGWNYGEGRKLFGWLWGEGSNKK